MFKSLTERVRQQIWFLFLSDEKISGAKLRVRAFLPVKIGSDTVLPLITCAASLAHHELLGSVEKMSLCDCDLTSVPAEHLASLVSSVTRLLTIRNVRGSGLVNILDSVKSSELYITDQSLGSEETRASPCAGHGDTSREGGAR